MGSIPPQILFIVGNIINAHIPGQLSSWQIVIVVICITGVVGAVAIIFLRYRYGRSAPADPENLPKDMIDKETQTEEAAG